MATKTDLHITALTDRGMERDHNEDYHGYIPDLEIGEWVFFDSREINGLSEKGSLLIVADGMGGANAGEIASKIAVESVKTYIQHQIAQAMPDKEDSVKSILIESVKTAQKDLVDHEKQFPETKGMGTTLAVAWVIKNKAFITWVGDSRLYLHNNLGLVQLSHDHSFVQELVDAGKLTQEQAFYHPQSNIITQNLGDAKRPPNPGYTTYNIQSGDIVIICSDGLNGMLMDSNIECFLNSNPGVSEAAKMLIDEANKAGGHDNITVLLTKIIKVDSPLPVEQRPLSNHGKHDPAAIDTIEAPVAQQKISAMRGKILLFAIIVVLLGFLAWQNKTSIIGLFKGDKSDSINNGATFNQNVRPESSNRETKPDNPISDQEKKLGNNDKEAEAGKNQTKTSHGNDRQLWIKAKTEGTKAAYQKYLNLIVDGVYADSAKAKIKAIDENKPVLDELIKVKNAYNPSKEDNLSKDFKREIDNCIKKAEAGVLTKESIIALWKIKNSLNINETGILELKNAIKKLFPNFDPDLKLN